MEKLVVACVQQRMRLPASLDAYRDDLRRFLRVAANKRARLVIFPELAGIMAAAPLLEGTQVNLLRRADLARRRQATLWQRLTGSLAASLARFLKADLRRSIAVLLDVAADDVWDAYVDVFGGLAREFDLTVVAPSAYLPDPDDNVIRNLAGVFGPNGELLGRHAKVMLHPEDEGLARPGSNWTVIQSEVGRLGLMLGNDVLYPEVGRLLAYQGAEFLVAQGACTGPVLYEKLRSGMLARMQDNQLFGAISFLVGHNELSLHRREPFVGRSAILAPQELTPRYSGILVEMANYRSESVLTAIWDFPALRDLWESSDTPVRRALPLEQAGQVLAELYQRLQRLPRRPDLQELPAPKADEAAGPSRPAEHNPTTAAPTPVRSLDELPVMASVTARWPLHGRQDGEPDQVGADFSDADFSDVEDCPLPTPPRPDPALQRVVAPTEAGADELTAEDETQEMDALLQPSQTGVQGTTEAERDGQENPTDA